MSQECMNSNQIKSWMSFDSDITDYKITHEHLEARKADDIAIQIKKLLIFNHQ